MRLSRVIDAALHRGDIIDLGLGRSMGGDRLAQFGDGIEAAIVRAGEGVAQRGQAVAVQLAGHVREEGAALVARQAAIAEPVAIHHLMRDAIQIARLGEAIDHLVGLIRGQRGQRVDDIMGFVVADGVEPARRVELVMNGVDGIADGIGHGGRSDDVCD